MSDNTCAVRSGSASENASTDTTPTIDIDELLAVLAEEYTEKILAALCEGSAPAREIAEKTGASRPTAYRRLNRLEAIGAVETAMVPSPGGQLRKEFRLVLDEVEFSVVRDDAAGSRSADADDASVRSLASEDAAARQPARASR